MRYPPARHPFDSDICVICPARDHKRASLIYNKIFVPAADLDFLDTPPEVTFGDDFGPNHPDWDSWFTLGLNVFSLTNRGMLGYDHYIAICYGENGLTVVRGYSSDSFGNDKIDTSKISKNRDPQYAVMDASAFPIIENRAVAYSAVLSNIPLISNTTSWDEILEFRKDKCSVEKSRRLRMWMRDASRAGSDAEAQDVVSQLLDDYTAAMRKHAIKTVAGGLTLVAAAGGAALAALAAGSPIAALSAGIGMASGTVAWILKQHCDYDDIKRGKGAEVAVFYEAAKRFGQ
jgi:hypothetical protein